MTYPGIEKEKVIYEYTPPEDHPAYSARFVGFPKRYEVRTIGENGPEFGEVMTYGEYSGGRVQANPCDRLLIAHLVAENNHLKSLLERATTFIEDLAEWSALDTFNCDDVDARPLFYEGRTNAFSEIEKAAREQLRILGT